MNKAISLDVFRESRVIAPYVLQILEPEPTAPEPEKRKAKPKRKRGPRKPRDRIAGLDWYPRLKLWKSPSGKCVLNPATLNATSYGWWDMLDRFGDTVVLNSYPYSSTTSQHQGQVRSWLWHHKIPYVQIEAPRGLGRLESARKHYEQWIADLAVAMARPRSNARKNKERAKETKRLKKALVFIAKLERIRRKEKRELA